MTDKEKLAVVFTQIGVGFTHTISGSLYIPGTGYCGGNIEFIFDEDGSFIAVDGWE